ncbi:MAG: cytochrome c oxidase assembly protein [Gemmatimonadaceae bacterium]
MPTPFVSFALLHVGAAFSWTRWTVHPSTVIGIGALAGIYCWRARVAKGIGDSARHPLLPGQYAAFFSGLVAMFASLNGPLHDLSDAYLFSAHMVQHLVLTLVVPPLLILGTPGWMIRPALGRGWIAAIAHRVTRPVWCYAIFNVVVGAWHLPPLYNAALSYHPVHIAMHLTFLVAAVLMWWPFLSPLAELPRLAYPGQMLYCFLMSIPMSIVSIYIAYADRVLYPLYAASPRIWPITPMEDQLIGGLIMWIPGGLFFYVVMTVVFFKWAARGDDSTAAAQVDWKPATSGA